MNSGGLDSALLGAVLKIKQKHTLHSVYIDTGQVNRIPAMAAAEITANKFCVDHHVVTVDFGQTPNYWETFYVDPPAEATMYDVAPNATWKQTSEAKEGERPFTDFHICPNWTMVEVSLAVAYAKMIGVNQVYSGHRLSVNEQYANTMNEMANQRIHRATRAMINMPIRDDISYRDVAVRLVGLPLTQTKIQNLRNEFSYTYSCRWEAPCGVCEKCTGRAAIGLV